MPLRIAFESEMFPSGTVSNGKSTLNTSWDDILWAAVTVGRPNLYYVFRYGAASVYEALFRWSMIRMALEQSSPTGYRLWRTTAFNSLDPTEKGAVNYFLGMAFTKLFADASLDTPWLLHLDVFRPQLNPQLTGRSRPDLVGQTKDLTQWHSFESKGRASRPDSATRDNAKAQAERLVSINGINTTLHVAAITYFRNDVLQFFWRDPEPKRLKPIEVFEIGDAWGYYYAPLAEILRDREGLRVFQQENDYVRIEEADLEVSVHPAIAKALFNSQWEHARLIAFEISNDLKELDYHADGIKIRAGDSWQQRFSR